MTSVLDLFPARPTLLAVGEPTHGAPGVLRARNELFRELVTDAGYRTITLETDCLAGLLVDDYVTGGDGTLDDVLARGLSHEWGAFGGNRDLVEWMRGFNTGRPAADRVRFAGFDGPLEITGAASPRAALTALHGFLTARLDPALLPCTAAALDELLGDDAAWPDEAAMLDPARSIGRTPAADRLRILAADLSALLDEHGPHLIAVSSPDEWFRALLFARTATGLLRYHYWMADPGAGRLSRLLGIRDAMMAANLRALAGRGPTLANAQNAHLQRDKSTMRMGPHLCAWWSAGAQVSTTLGAGYAFVATALGTYRAQGVDVPPPDTIEGILYAGPAATTVVDPRDLDAGAPARVSPWFGYAPLDPAHLPRLDGLLFVRDA
ncbi:erythromycin esterase family protein [Actinoplanes sp. CA-030573]|uniref:erythromycin esterase family protein n=1 Tax=Actinoplanes sp. CA-030573 TaxID=3239898 RepID=UPI003D8CF966